MFCFNIYDRCFIVKCHNYDNFKLIQIFKHVTEYLLKINKHTNNYPNNILYIKSLLEYFKVNYPPDNKNFILETEVLINAYKETQPVSLVCFSFQISDQIVQNQVSKSNKISELGKMILNDCYQELSEIIEYFEKSGKESFIYFEKNHQNKINYCFYLDNQSKSLQDLFDTNLDCMNLESMNLENIDFIDFFC